MKFNLFAIILAGVAIGLGSVVGSALTGMVGFAGGIVGTLVTGFVIYLIYAFLSGMPIQLFAGLIFALMVWLTNMLAGMISGWTGLGGGLIGLGISAVILSFLWGNWGAGMAGQTQSTASTGKKRRKKRR